jgi:hypothetical protein
MARSLRRKSVSPRKRSARRSPKRLSEYQQYVKSFARKNRGKYTGPHAGRKMISAAARSWKRLRGGGYISNFTNYIGLKGKQAESVKKGIKSAYKSAQEWGGALGEVAVSALKSY